MSRTFMISWDVTKQDQRIIAKIAERAHRLAFSHGLYYPVIDASMDITACHANGTPLALDKLLAFDDGNFGHDVFGIRRFIDRDTGMLGGRFFPRCSAKVAA